MKLMSEMTEKLKAAKAKKETLKAKFLQFEQSQEAPLKAARQNLEDAQQQKQQFGWIPFTNYDADIKSAAMAILSIITGATLRPSSLRSQLPPDSWSSACRESRHLPALPRTVPRPRRAQIEERGGGGSSTLPRARVRQHPTGQLPGRDRGCAAGGDGGDCRRGGRDGRGPRRL